MEKPSQYYNQEYFTIHREFEIYVYGKIVQS